MLLLPLSSVTGLAQYVALTRLASAQVSPLSVVRRDAAGSCGDTALHVVSATDSELVELLARSAYGEAFSGIPQVSPRIG
ncbi:hypothetical protein AA983_06880 [Dermacoccus sp. PE3]|nr:hypothetical protein AA983_06880 [Dermacoccus sp. PE3]